MALHQTANGALRTWSQAQNILGTGVAPILCGIGIGGARPPVGHGMAVRAADDVRVSQARVAPNQRHAGYEPS